MHRCRRQLWRVSRYVAGFAVLFWLSWAAFTFKEEVRVHRPRARGLTTIVAYSEDKFEELERPNPVTCDTLPVSPQVKHINRTWTRGAAMVPSEWQRVPGSSVSLYAAYYDQRKPQHYIRILAKFQGRKISSEEVLYCQTRPQNAEDTSIEVVAAKPLEIWWHEWDPYSDDVETPLLLSCSLTEPLRQPSIVSVVAQPCDAALNAFFLNPEKYISYRRNFTICVKDMNFEKDISENLVEWIETNKLLGAEKIDMYIERVNRNVEKVVQSYRDMDFVRLFQIPISSNNRSLWQRRRDHIITYNDCLYRNIHETTFVIPLDVDEIILPKMANNWSDLVNRLNNSGWNPSQDSAILIKNVFFFDFMQGVSKYKYANDEPLKNKIYDKKDDVRLKNSKTNEFLDYIIGNNLLDIVNNASIIPTRKIERDTNKELDKYVNICGKKLYTPRLFRSVKRSALVSPVGQYTKSMMLTKRVLTAFNHYPLASVGVLGFAGWEAPFSEVQLNHYKETCNSTVMDDCGRYRRRAVTDASALRLRRPLLRALANAPCSPTTTK